jgi:hypothetical protein
VAAVVTALIIANAATSHSAGTGAPAITGSAATPPTTVPTSRPAAYRSVYGWRLTGDIATVEVRDLDTGEYGVEVTVSYYHPPD